MAQYNLNQHGDGFEQKYWNLFLSTDFPEYEEFWQKHVIPLTNRPADIHFKDNATLTAEGKTDEDICIAQLHYTILRHLAIVYELLKNQHPNQDDLIIIFTRIVGAQDLAFELLERYTNSGFYNAWLSQKTNDVPGSRDAKVKWQKNHNYPLQNIRDYRNHLVHGRMSPGITANTYYYPAIGKEEKYFDWRIVTSSNRWVSEIGITLLPSLDIVKQAWDKTLAYFKTNWTNELL